MLYYIIKIVHFVDKYKLCELYEFINETKN